MSDKLNLPDTPELEKMAEAAEAGTEQAPVQAAAEKADKPSSLANSGKKNDEDFKNNIWAPFLRPIVMLVAICFTVAFLLGITNNVTKPLIAANESAAAGAARRAVLPEADDFTEMEVGEEYPNILSFHAANNGAGHVIQAFAKGYGGNVNVMVGFDAAGVVTGIKVLETNETPGLGKNVEKESFTAQFAGGGQNRYAISASPGDGGIAKVASATISTGAVVSAVNAALDFYAENVQGQASLTPEDIRAALLPNAGQIVPLALAAPPADVLEAWKGDDGNYIIYAQGYGYYEESPITAAVAITPDGVILAVWLDTSDETDGLGSEVGRNQAFLDQFSGLSGEVALSTQGGSVVAVANATHTSQGAVDAVNTAIAALPTVKEAG